MPSTTKKYRLLVIVCLIIGSLMMVPLASGQIQSGTGLTRVSNAANSIVLDAQSLSSFKREGNPKLATNLNNLVKAYSAQPDNWQNAAETTGLLAQGDQVLVELRFKPTAVPGVVSAVKALGGSVRHDTAPGLYEVWLPIGALDTVTIDPDVYFVRSARLVELHAPAVGASTTQGVAASNANIWHASGITGTGKTIAIIDQFNNTGGEVASLQASGDWPPSGQLTMVSKHGGSFGANGGNHGMATLEIAYDMAPGANFIAYDIVTVGDWYAAIGDADAAGADIISASLGAPLDGVGDGSAMAGSIAEAAGLARSNGRFIANSAGNSRQLHWGGIYLETGSIPAGGYAGSHDWGSGSNLNFGVFCYPIDTTLSVNMYWDDWAAPVDHDYDLFLYQWDKINNPGGFDVIASSTNLQDGTPGQLPQESASVTISEASGVTSGCSGSGAAVAIVVAKMSAATDRNLQLFASGFGQLSTFVVTSSLGFPADSANVFTVAAIDVATSSQEPYSSEGPILPSGGGPSPAAPVAGPQKPDIASFANVDTQSYGPGVFNGTSSAAPHVAGMAALIWQNTPTHTVSTLEAELISLASTPPNDLGTPGHDYAFGWGRSQFRFTPTAIEQTSFAAAPDDASEITAVLSVLGLVFITTGLLGVRAAFRPKRRAG